MKPVADITKRSVFLRDPPRERSIVLSADRQAGAIRTLRSLARSGLIAALTACVWVAQPSFVFAPQPFSASVQGVFAFVTEEERQLEERLQKIEQQISGFDQNIQQTRQEAQSLKRDVALLDNQIKKLDLQIAATDLQVKRLTSRIKNTQSAIYESQLKIARQKESLAHSLQAIHETDQVSLLEMLLADASITDFFANVNAIFALQLRAQTELDQVYALKRVLEDQEAVLSDAKEEQVALLLIQQAQKTEVGGAKKAKDQLLILTQGKETLYKELKKAAEKTASEIRTQLFRLRGGGELSFGDAYNFAKAAGDLAGVRPALVLAVLSQESALGRNVGRCTYNQVTSRGTTVMNPNQHDAFRRIVTELNLNPETMPISCPIISDGAYGGAMGIAQFMPSTWMLYKERIQRMIGYTPSPWDPRSAFTATALYLADAGAKARTIESERQAAARYYAGGNWRTFLYSYGSRVIDLARRFQDEINILEREAR